MKQWPRIVLESNSYYKTWKTSLKILLTQILNSDSQQLLPQLQNSRTEKYLSYVNLKKPVCWMRLCTHHKSLATTSALAMVLKQILISLNWKLKLTKFRHLLARLKFFTLVKITFVAYNYSTEIINWCILQKYGLDT